MAARSSWKRWRSLVLQIVLIGAVVVAVTAYQTRHHLARQPAPNFTLRDLSGKEVSLSDYRGKKVLLHFFATWCGVCRAELPSLKGVYARLAPDEAVLAVVEDSDDVEAIRSYARDHSLSYPILLADRDILRTYRVTAFPTNYFVDGAGRIRSSTTGLSTWLGMTLRLIATPSMPD